MLTIEDVAMALVAFSQDVISSFEFLASSMDDLVMDIDRQVLLTENLFELIQLVSNHLNILTGITLVNTLSIIVIIAYLVIKPKTKSKKKTKKKTKKKSKKR